MDPCGIAPLVSRAAATPWRTIRSGHEATFLSKGLPLTLDKYLDGLPQVA